MLEKHYWGPLKGFKKAPVSAVRQDEDYDIDSEFSDLPKPEKLDDSHIAIENSADVAILLNAYKNASLIRDLTQGEWDIISALERKFVFLASSNQP